MASREEAEAEALKLFLSISLDETVAKNALKNPKFVRALTEVCQEAGVANSGCEKSTGNLLYTVATKYPANALSHRPKLLDYVVNGQIKSNQQLDGAFDYLKKVGTTDVVAADLEEAAGVGVVVTAEEISAAVADAIKANEEKLREERYHCNTNIFVGQVNKALKWAEGATVRAEMEAQVEKFLGPKTEADLKPPEKKKPTKAPKEPKPDAKKAAEVAEAEEPAVPDDPYAFLPKPDQNNTVHTSIAFSDGSTMHVANSPEQLKAHLERMGGSVVTRFPPEPNGYLHIGHAKAMFVDFGMARQYGGKCYLRFDDTNPEAEKQEYIDHIVDIVTWMGWEPWKVTYTSDYFDQLYAYAVDLIKRGHAFVCHQTKAEIEVSREKREPSPWRDRPIEESLKIFEDMRRGMVDEGKAVLRMKMDYKNDNYNMFDQIAYRIKFVAHPHAGDRWCVYPSYDFAHCLVDAIEDVSHSLCTLEFESRRASYYWLLEALDTFKPLVWEYARLNVTNTVMSKRKLNKLCTGGFVSGWDDPRLLTLAGMRRRGITPAAINNFIREIGITRNDNTIPMHKLEHHVRADLDATSPRALAVLRPLKVIVTNLPESHFEEVDAKVFPGRSEDTYKVPFTRVVYIERTDFREIDSKDYYGLAPNKSVMFRYAYIVKCTGFKKDSSGGISEVHVMADLETAGKKPPKGVLSWVAQPRPGVQPAPAEVRIYDVLFKSEDPASMEDFLEDMNPGSLEVISGAYVSPHVAAAKPGDRFQFERLGYFCADTNSKQDALVFNRTVTLKESFPKFSK